MTLKQPFERVLEPDSGLIHLGPPHGMDQVTLCGLTDWLGTSEKGKPTSKQVTCQPCRWIADYCQNHRRLAKPRKSRQL